MFKSINGGKLPQRATKYSAGFDVFANEDAAIGAGETKLIGLGIAIDIEPLIESYIEKHMMAVDSPSKAWELYARGRFLITHYLELHIRSSLRVKGLTSLGTGIIDIDYPDEIKMVVNYQVSHAEFNPHFRVIELAGATDDKFYINSGDKIGQLILKRHEGYLLPQEYTLDAERKGGFGSTGQ